MSNSKVRKQLEAQEAKGKLLEGYKKNSNFILNYQMCKAYYKDSALPIMAIVERILKAKYNLPWQEKIIRKALSEVRGQKNPLIEIPQFNYSKNVHDIFAEFVERNFDKMIADRKTNGLYPLGLRDIIEKYS